MLLKCKPQTQSHPSQLGGTYYRRDHPKDHPTTRIAAPVIVSAVKHTIDPGSLHFNETRKKEEKRKKSKKRGAFGNHVGTSMVEGIKRIGTTSLSCMSVINKAATDPAIPLNSYYQPTGIHCESTANPLWLLARVDRDAPLKPVGCLSAGAPTIDMIR